MNHKSSDPFSKDASELGRNTKLVRAGRAAPGTYGFTNPTLNRGSTVLFPTTQARTEAYSHRMDQTLVYGIQGSSTHHALEDVICEIEGASRCQIVSSGLAAITTAMLAFLRAGDHCLIVDSAYGPGQNFANELLSNFGVEVSYYAPSLTADLSALFRPNTKVVLCESPGSNTFEMQDVPAIGEIAQAKGAKVLIDNTWGLNVFRPFEKGADVSIQALTKYAGGHSDLMLGSISTIDEDDWKKVRTTALALGQYASPDDCWLALRGTRTLSVRMRQQMVSALEIAAWLRERPEIAEVYYPALPGAPGHEIWRRDYTGASSLFAVRLGQGATEETAEAFVNALQWFGIGSSWGGYESLAVPLPVATLKRAFSNEISGPLVRLHVGLEDTKDLIRDLENALQTVGWVRS